MLHLALLGHLLSALAFVAGMVLAGAAQAAARRQTAPADVALLLGLARTGVVLVGAGALGVLGFGLWLVHLTGVGLGAGWVLAALILLVAAGALGAAGGRAPRRARERATALAARGAPADAELRARLTDRRADAANAAAALAVLAILVLMVWKPG